MLKEGERIDRLIKEGIDIIQSKSVFSFSLDAVLLANFAKLPKKENSRIIDACTGNGAVAFLMCGQTNAKIQGIEIQEALVDMAKRTVALNHLEHKVDIIQADFKTIDRIISPDSVDAITINPPYFPVHEQSKRNDNLAYSLARHEIALSLEDWVKQCSRLLKYKGKVFCVHRPDRVFEIAEMMRKYHITVNRVQFVHPKQGKNANIVLIEGIKHGQPGGAKILPPIIVYDEQQNYTEIVRGMLFGTN